MAFGAVDVVAVDNFVGPAETRAPAFEDFLHAGVVGGVWVVVEVVVGGFSGGVGELLIVPTQYGVDDVGVG